MSMTVKQCVEKARIDRAERAARADSLRAVPQRPVPAGESVCFFLLPALFVVTGIFPTATLMLLPVILVILFAMYRRFGLYLPLAAIAMYAGTALWLGYDALTLLYSVFLAVAFLGLTLSVQLRPFLLCAGVAVVLAVCGMLAGAGAVCLAGDCSPTEAVESYVKEHPDDGVISSFSRYRYEKDTTLEQKLGPDEEGYGEAVNEFYAGYLRDELDGYIPYHCIHFGGLFGYVGYFLAVAMCRATSSAYDDIADERSLKISGRCLGGARREQKAIGDMRVPRWYLLIFLLPALVIAIVSEYAVGVPAVAATVMHGLVTVPCGFAFFTLVCYYAGLTKGKGRVAAAIIVALIALANLVVPVVFFVCSIFGVCDIILDLRYWTEFIARE